MCSLCVDALSCAGAVRVRSQLNLGLGAYGRSWTLADRTKTAIGSPSGGDGTPATCTRAPDRAWPCCCCELGAWERCWSMPWLVC